MDSSAAIPAHSSPGSSRSSTSTSPFLLSFFPDEKEEEEETKGEEGWEDATGLEAAIEPSNLRSNPTVQSNSIAASLIL